MSIEQLRKQAKERLTVLRTTNPSAKLADAQFVIARENGFDEMFHSIASVPIM